MSKVRLSEIPPEEVVAKVNQLGLGEAAKVLGRSSPTLCRWLKDNGFVRKSQYIKKEAATPNQQM